MLVLSRKVGERVVIDGEIVVEVLEAGAGRIRLGIEAPRDTGVWREELVSKRESQPVPHCPILAEGVPLAPRTPGEMP
jgi:carbon storage regulator